MVGISLLQTSAESKQVKILGVNMRLSTNQIQKQIKQLYGWSFGNNEIKKQFIFKGFKEAMSFVNSVAGLAESADHHPDITINYRKVTLALTTHSEGGVTKKDFDLARSIENI